jgi:MFS family permease
VFLAWSVANNLFRQSMEMQLLKTDTGARTGRRVGLFVAWRFGGLLAGTILAGYLLHWLDFRGSFRALAGVGVLLLAPACLLPPTRLAPVRLADYFADLRDLRVLLFAGWMFLFTTHWGVESTCYSLFLRRTMGLSLRSMGWYMSAEFAAVVAAALFVAPRLGRRLSLTNLALGGVALSGVGHIGMTIGNVWISVAFRAVHGLGDGALAVLLYVGFSRLFNIERLGGAAGAINLAMMIGQIAGAMIAGPVGEKFGYALPIWTSGVLLLALATPLAAKSWRDRRVERIE